MKKKILGIFVCMLLTIGCSFTVAISTNNEKQIFVTQNNSDKQRGNTLLTNVYLNKVIEVDSFGTIVWEQSSVIYPVDVERLANGNTLISELKNERIIEIDFNGVIVWGYSSASLGPWDAERLVNGNTLIADAYGSRVIEVDSSGSIVWEITGLSGPGDVERLSNGNTLITEIMGYRVIEVDTGGNIVWQYAVAGGSFDAERLANGNTLIADAVDRVIEVDSSGSIVWEKTGLYGAVDAERLDNGNTLISEYSNYRVIEVDTEGTIVWEYTILGFPWDAERINYPPDAPTITGQIGGKPGVQYEYTFNAIDPDSHNIRYIINWDDNTSDTTGYYPSGTDAKIKHTWSNEGTYIITAKAQDIHDFEGPEGTLAVNIPRVRAVNRPFPLRLFEQFPNLFPILRYILGV